MTADPTTTAAAVSDPTAASAGDATAGGGIDRLNAFDGLFLRAEHLTTMQDYAHELARGVGAAGGPGVVTGFDVHKTTTSVEIGPGLAIDAAGRPLRSRHVVEIPLADIAVTTNDFIVIEVVRDRWTYGDAAVQAVLCPAPCDGGRERPYAADGVLVRAVVRKLPDNPERDRLRGWLADRIFTDDAAEAGAWPTADDPDLDGRTWTPDRIAAGDPAVADPPPGEPAVPLALLLPTGGDPKDWTLDVWAERRDRGAAPPEELWRWRLGMRPWSVFVAQVLQFQDQVAAAYPADGPAPPSFRQILDRMRQLTGDLDVSRPRVTAVRSQAKDLVEIMEGAAAAQPATLTESGFVALPPAGLLPVRVDGDGDGDEKVRAEVHRLLGGGVTVRWAGSCAPTDVGELLEQARHRPRIPLNGGVAEVFLTDAGWVLFRAVSGVVPVPPPTDRVDVYVVADPQRVREVEDAIVKGLDLGDLGEPIPLRYPANGWAQPVGDYPAVQEAIRTGRWLVAVLARERPRLPLSTVRALLLGLRFPDPDRLVDVPPLWTTVRAVTDDPGPDADGAVILLGRRSERDGDGDGNG